MASWMPLQAKSVTTAISTTEMAALPVAPLTQVVANGVVDTVVGETCDDGNTLNNDGCDEVRAASCCRSWKYTAKDLVDVNWLDNCVDAVGQNITVTLRDEVGVIVYQESGTKNDDWTDYNRDQYRCSGKSTR